MTPVPPPTPGDRLRIRLAVIATALVLGFFSGPYVLIQR